MPLGVACRSCGRVQVASLCAKCAREQKTLRSSRGRTFYHSRMWRRLREACIRRDGGCVVCESRVRLFAHHLVARDAGGADDLSNLVALCAACHGTLEAALKAGRENEQTRALDLILLTRRT